METTLCARCARPIPPTKPRRTGRSFGLDGRLCRSCYETLWVQHRAGRGTTPTGPTPRRSLDPALPCVRCTQMGYRLPGKPVPARYHGEPFGVTGAICERCYQSLRWRQRAGRPLAPLRLPGPPPKVSWSPCARCGTPDGYRARPNHTPKRFAGARYGFDGELCLNCVTTLKHQARAGRPFTPYRGSRRRPPPD